MGGILKQNMISNDVKILPIPFLMSQQAKAYNRSICKIAFDQNIFNHMELKVHKTGLDYPKLILKQFTHIYKGKVDKTFSHIIVRVMWEQVLFTRLLDFFIIGRFLVVKIIIIFKIKLVP